MAVTLISTIVGVIRVTVMVLSTTFNNIAAISWRSIYWWRYIVHGENHRPVTDNFDHIMLYRAHL